MNVQIKFACMHCKDKAIEEYKKTHKIGWTKLEINQLKDFDKSSFIRVASEVFLTKGTERINGFDGEDSWDLTCSVCKKQTSFSRGLGNI